MRIWAKSSEEKRRLLDAFGIGELTYRQVSRRLALIDKEEYFARLNERTTRLR